MGSSRSRWRALLRPVPRSLLVVVLAGLGACVAAESASARTIEPGFDLFATTPGSTTFDFAGRTEIPAGFFGPGSEPFGGTVPLQGVPIGYFNGHAIGDTDTIVHRLDPVTLPSPTSKTMVPIELTQLSLQSAAPITIHFADGTTELWNLKLDASPTVHPNGSMMIDGVNAAGGMVHVTLPEIPRLTFTQEGTSQVKFLDFGLTTSPSAYNYYAYHWKSSYSYDSGGRLIRVLHHGFCDDCVNGKPHTIVEQSTVITQGVHPATKLTLVPAGFDLFETDPAGTHFSFSSMPLPGGFFDPGSLPFSGTVDFHGQPLGTFNGFDVGTADTVVHRMHAASFKHAKTATVPIELVALSLKSVTPIQVSYANHHVETWVVSAGVSTSTPSRGKMKMTKLDDSSGKFDTKSFNVYPELTFTRQSDGAVRRLDTGSSLVKNLLGKGIQFRQKGAPWQRGCRGPALIVSKLSQSFCPSLDRDAKKVTSEEEAKLAAHGVRPAQPMEIPPLGCLVTPSIMLAQGQSMQVPCELQRHEFIDSFFDVFFAVQPETPPAGIGIQVTPPTGTIARGQGASLRAQITAAHTAQLGPHTLLVDVTSSAGDDRIKSFFDVFVDIQPGAQCSGTLSYPGPPHVVGYAFQCTNVAINRFRVTLHANVNITNASPVNPSGFTCVQFSSDGIHQDGLDCTNSGSVPANTMVQGFVQTFPDVASGAGATLDVAPTGQALQTNVSTLNGP